MPEFKEKMPLISKSEENITSEIFESDFSEKYKYIFENCPIGIYITTPAGRILSANPVLVRMLAYESFEELAKRNLENDGFENLNDSREGFKRKLEEKGELIGYENAWLRKDGRIIYVRENARVVKGCNGECFYEGTVEDITDKVISEKSLKDSEEQLKVLFNGNPDPVMLINPQTRIIVNVNPSACQLLKYTKQEILGKSFIDFVPKERNEIASEAFSNHVKITQSGEKIIPYDGFIVASDDTSIPVEITVQMVTVQDEKLLYSVLRDVSKRKKLEAALIESEESYRLIFESSLDGILFTNPNGEIYHANPAATEILGWTEEEICRLGRKGILDITDANLKLALEERERKGKLLNELRFKRKDGTIFPAEVSSRVFRLKDGSLRTCTVIRDITEKKKADEIIKDTLEFNSKIFESSPVGKAVYNSSGQCVSANENFCKLIGATKEQVLSQNYRKLQSWKKYGLFQMAEEVLANGVEIHKDIYMITTFGKEVWMNFNAVRFYSKGEAHLLLMNSDATERIRMEKIISQSERHFRSLVQNSSDVFVLLNSQGIITYVSQSVTHIVGYSPEEMLNTEGFSWIHPDDVQSVMEMFGQLLNNTGQTVTAQVRMPRKDGGYRWIEAIATNLLNDPAVNAIVANYRDIDHRKKSELKLQESEEKFRTSVETMIDCFALFESKRNENGQIEDFIYRYINEAGCRNNMMPKEKLIGYGMLEILPNHKETGLFYEYCNLVETGIPLVKESLLYEDNYAGKYLCRAFEINAVKLGDGFAVAWRDISSRKQAEAAFRLSESRYRSLASNFPNGSVILFDNELRYILAEGDELKRLGLTKEKMEGRTISEVVPGWVSDIIVPHWKATLKGSFEVFELESPSGIWEIRTLPIRNDSGEIIAGMEMLQNITERKRIEKELKELNANKDKFFSIISHDLKGPFTSLLGFSEFLANDFDELTSDEVRSFAVNIHKSAKNVFRLLENLLQWSRLQTGRMEYSPVRFELNELLEQSISIYQISALKKRINIQCRFLEEHRFVYADRLMIDTVVRNFLSNAVKFTYHGGEVNLFTEVCDDSVRITVADTGIGISEFDMRRLFKLGENISTLGTDNEKGTGLGLILCKEFIEKNNGKLSVESKPGEGTRFSFTLPLSKEI